MDPQSMNSYSYARNSPINLSDPSGLMWTGSQWVSFAGGVVVGAGIAVGTAAAIGAIAVASPVIAITVVSALAIYGAAEIGGLIYVSYAENNGNVSGMLNDAGEYIEDNPYAVGNVVGGVAGCYAACEGATNFGAKGANKLGSVVDGFLSKESTQNLELGAQKSIKQSQKSIKTFEKNIKLHEDKINNPENYVSDYSNRDPREQQGLINHWQKEINVFKSNIQKELNNINKKR